MTSIDNELLLSQIVGDDDPAAWDELASRAAQSPHLWRELAESYRDQVRLVRVLDHAAAHADVVEAAPRLAIRRPTAWAGWIVAAMIALAWTIGITGPGKSGVGMQHAGVIPVGSADEALDAYLDFGREQELVIGEMPSKVVIETRPNPAGEGLEVIYIRRLVERRFVDRLYDLGPTAERAEGAALPASLSGRM